MENDTIGILPHGGTYRYTSTQSRKAIEWLILEEQRRRYRIIQAGNSKEYRLPCGILVDGYYEDAQANGYVFQFYGCFWHGCLSCFKINRHAPLRGGDSLDTRYEQTLLCAQRIRNLNYNLIEMWECEFDRQVRDNLPEMLHVQNNPLLKVKPLNPREAFFGGRTENYVTLYDAAPGEKIKYYDVTSLYPFVNKTATYPIGHPKVYVNEECIQLTGTTNNLNLIEGIVKCRVLPPRNLYIPVLPMRAHGRLMFPLCRICCEELSQRPCEHSIREREFIGTWVVDELRKSIQCGYKILEIFEIYQYKVIRYNKESNTNGLFNKYVDTFLKEKQEASDFPPDCVNEAATDEYIAEYLEREGILLDKTNIRHNPGFRSLSKMILNAFWGKFGQRENLPQTEIVSTRERLLEMLNSPEISITGLLPINQNLMYVNYEYQDNSILPTPTSNCVIAAYTTAHARLHLYGYLEKLNERVLYCDTDSIIFISREDEWEPQCGKFLGELTDELEEYGKGSHITSFISGGPKFYAYLVQTSNNETKEICKVKGITLNFVNDQFINYNSVKQLIIGTSNAPIILTYDAIRRTEFHRVVTRTESKTTRVCNTKRRCVDVHKTVPFGYIQ